MADLYQAFRQNDLLESVASREGVVPDLANPVEDDDRLQSSAVAKGVSIYNRHLPQLSIHENLGRDQEILLFLPGIADRLPGSRSDRKHMITPYAPSAHTVKLVTFQL